VSSKGICCVKCTVYGFGLYYPIFFHSLATVTYKDYLSRIFNLHKNQFLNVWNVIWKWSSLLCACALWCQWFHISHALNLYCKVFIFQSLLGFFLYYYCYYLVVLSFVTGLFFLVLLLNQQWFPLLRLHVSYCSTFDILCDVPITAVFFSEYIECFPGMLSKYFFKTFVTIQWLQLLLV